MFSTNLIILGIFSLISTISIIIQAGWKFTHKWIPKLPINKRWSDTIISTGQLTVILFIFYTVNIWYWTDSSENRSDIYKMSDTIKLLELKASNASQYFSTTTNIMSFNEAVDSLPEEAEEYTNMLNAFRKFNGPELLKKFHGFVLSGQCAATVGTNPRDLYNKVQASKGKQAKVENNPIWPVLRKFMRDGSTYEAPFTDKREQIKQHLESVDESMKYIVNKFKEKEQDLTNKMIQTTNEKNRELFFWYVIPSMIVFIFTILSIYTTTFHPQLQSSLIFRMILNVLFHIVAIHVVVVFIFEIVSNSNQCQPDSELFDFLNFEIPSFNKSSRTITKEDFLNCTAMKSHIFSVDEIFIPTTIYDEYMKPIPDALIPKLASPNMFALIAVFGHIQMDHEQIKPLIPIVLGYTTACPPLREHKSTIEQIENLYAQLEPYLEPFRIEMSRWGDLESTDVINTEKSRPIVLRGVPKMKNAIVASIQNHNNMINESGFDCSSISEAFQHGNIRTCHVINIQIISIAKLVLIGCSIISIIIHILKNRKYDVVLEKSNNQQQENQTII